MRDELKHIERIERYLENEMDEAEKSEFENEMKNDSELQKETEFYKNLREGISRQAIKIDIKKAQFKYVKEAQRWARLKKFLFGGGSFLITVIVVAVLVLPDELKENSFVSKLVKGNKYEEVIKNFESDPYKDYLPESEFFTIDANNDTTLTSADGIKLYLPKGSLRMPDGTIPTEPINIEIADANNADENMLGNLLGQNEGLNVEDVAFVNAKVGDIQLVPDGETPPYMEIPTAFTMPNKRLFSGKRDKNGNINWDKPKLPENYLTPVKFKYLDYFPDSLKAVVSRNLPYKGREIASRELLDTLFYNTPNLQQIIKTTGDPNDLSIPVIRDIKLRYTNCDSIECGICPSYIKAFANEKYECSLLATREFMQRLKIIYKTCDKELLNIYINNTDKQLWKIDELAYEYLSSKEKTEKKISKPGIVSGEILAKKSEILIADSQELFMDEASASGASERAENSDYSNYFKGFSMQKLTNVPNSHIYAALIAKEYEKDLTKVLKEQKRIEKTYKAEIKANTKATKAHEKRVEKYQNLVKKRVKTRMKAYGFKVTTLGWKAIAEIQTVPAVVPEPLILNVKDYAQFDHYHSYFAVTDLGVMGKLNRNGDGQFIMNEHRIINLPRYNTSQITLVTVGFKGKEIYLAQMPYSTEQSGTVEMNPILTPTNQAKSLLNKLGGRDKKHSIWYDMEQQKAFYTEFVRRQKLAKENEFRRQIHNVIYPCCALSQVRPNGGYEEPKFEVDDTDNTMWEQREGIELIHPDGKKEYIFKHKDPVRFKKYFKMGGGKSTVILKK